MAELQPHPYTWEDEVGEPQPITESIYRIDRMTNQEVRTLGRFIIRGAWPDEAEFNGGGELYGRYILSLKSFGRDVPMRAYELVDEVIQDRQATGCDMEIACSVAYGIGLTDPIAAGAQLRTLAAVVKRMEPRNTGEEDCIEWGYWPFEALHRLDDKLPGAVGAIPTP